MQSIIVCDECGYSRASDQDGRSFVEVCGICHTDDCVTPSATVDICQECHDNPWTDSSSIIDPGESLFT